MPNSNLFQNRTGTNLNRRKLTIISQSANEMIVDVERADNVQQNNQGTTLNADVMNALDDRIIAAENNSSTALSTANAANAKALYVESQLAERGSTVRFNGIAQAEVNFSSDPQTQIDNKQNTLIFDTSPTNQSANIVSSGAIYNALYNSSIPTVDVYDATITNTSKNVTSNGHVLVTKTRSKRILEFYFNTINMSNFIDKDVNTSCLIQTVIPALSNVNSGYFLGVILSQTNASVTNDYMNSHSAQSGNISSFASSNTAFACTVTMRRAYGESDQYACLVVKIVEELL